MLYSDLRKIKKIFFSYTDVAEILKVSEDSAKVYCNRFIKQNLIIRPKRDFYILREKWENITLKQLMELANLVQVPSYISLTTALIYYGITSQVQQNFIESISVMRTKEIDVESTVFKYFKIKRNLYSGFNKVENLFIAMPEKALLDALYLNVLGKYRLDLNSIDFNKFDKEKLNYLLKNCHPRIRDMIRKILNGINNEGT
jgi:predicted transcriptional regulator of viral defense system